jgi:hypothetical protein
MQHRFTKRFGLFLTGLLTTVSAFAIDYKPWDEGDDYVRLDAVNAANQQPYNITAEQLRPMLTRFYKKETGKDPAPYFSEDESDRLSKLLAAALAKAHSTDDILFGSSWRPGFFLLTPRQLNAGRIFVTDGYLNLLIGTCNENQDVSYFEAHGRVRPLNQGSRSKPASDLGCQLVSANGAERVDNRPDWLRLNIANAATQAPSYFPPAAARPAPAPGPAPTLAPAPAPVAAPMPAPAVSAPAQTGVLPPAPLNKLEERLMLLKRLHDNGLVTDEEFAQKRAAIVKDL